MGEAALRLASTLSDVWLSIDESATLLGQPPRTLRSHLAKYVTRHVAKDEAGGTRYEVLLASLPIEAISKWEARAKAPVLPISESDLVMSAYERADQRTRRHFDRWSQVLLGTDSISGRKDLEAWVANWNASHPDAPISVQSLYRVRSQVREQGIIGLLLRETQLPETTVRDEWFAMFSKAYLCENRISAADARIVAMGAANRTDDTFPSTNAFLRRLQREYSPAVISFARDGEKKYFDRHGYFVERDYSQLVSGRIWVGDSRVLDILVTVDGQTNPVRPWVTLFICMKSYLPMGWWFHWSAPSAENSMRAIRHGIDLMGKPEWLYLDNGREYKNKDFTGVSRGHIVNFDTQHTGSLAAVLGIQVHFAEAKRSRAKPIERQFLEMKNHFDRFWPTFKGGNAVEKPNRLKEVLRHASEIPTFDKVKIALDQFFAEQFPQKTCLGKTHKGRTRAQVWEQDIALHGPLSRVSPDTSAMLVTKLARGSIGRTGFRLAALDATWWAEWMPVYKGRAVVLRYDPDDLSIAKCYEATEHGHGAFIGTCDLMSASGAMVHSGDLLGLAQVGDRNRIHKQEIKRMKAALPQASAHDLEHMREMYGRGIGSRALTIPESNTTVLTEHDRTAAQVRRESRSGRADLTRLSPNESTNPKRDWIWFDDQAAAAG